MQNLEGQISQFAENLGLTIRTERVRRGLSQTDLAELAGVSLNFVSQLESGKTTARMDKVLVLIYVLGLKLEVVHNNPVVGP